MAVAKAFILASQLNNHHSSIEELEQGPNLQIKRKRHRPQEKGSASGPPSWSVFCLSSRTAPPDAFIEFIVHKLDVGVIQDIAVAGRASGYRHRG